MSYIGKQEKRKLLTGLGNHIKQVRKSKGFSQAKLARRMGRDRQTMYRVETGAVNVGYIFLLEISSALGVDMSELLEGLNNKDSRGGRLQAEG